MLIAGGTPGQVKDIQGKVASARKVFRILKVPLCYPCTDRSTFSPFSHVLAAIWLAHIFNVESPAYVQPLETLTPVLREPYLPGKKHIVLELLPKVKSVFMASYFGFDHLVWLGSVGMIKEKALLERSASLQPCPCTRSCSHPRRCTIAHVLYLPHLHPAT